MREFIRVSKFRRFTLVLKSKMKRIYLDFDDELISAINRRAEKNLMSPEKQIEDIVRRSMVSFRKKATNSDSKVDDSLISVFSRANNGRKKIKNGKR